MWTAHDAPSTVWERLAPKAPVRTWRGRYIFARRVVRTRRRPWPEEIVLDLPGDRQEFVGPREGSEPFVRWLNQRLDALLRTAIEQKHVLPTSDTVIEVQEGRFHARATPAMSSGYLYVVAWDQPEAQP